MRRKVPGLLAVAAAGLAGSAGAANITPYYLIDTYLGGSVYEITNGVVTNTFPIVGGGDPVAIRSSIWLADTFWFGDPQDGGATEYTLGGMPTGNVSIGGRIFRGLVDGATGRHGRNYAVQSFCCGVTNSVTVANGDWSNQQVLFDLNLPEGVFGSLGIAFDPSDDTLFVAHAYPNDPETYVIFHYGLDGTLLDRFDTQLLVGLAYEQATDTFWGYNLYTVSLVQFDRTGTVLQEVEIPNFPPDRPGYGSGGEMPFIEVPEPGTLALLGLGLAGLGLSRRRKAN